MAVFSSTTKAEAVVPHDRARIWDALVDASLVGRMTPFVKRIEASPSGEHWVWSMTGLEVMGIGFSPTFTERMTLKDQERIEFEHDPPSGAKERAGVTGWYDLRDVEGGTRLETSLEVCISLPLPRAAGPAVRSAMKGVMATMGDRFSKNLLAHLAKG
ncbi:SRPBCC family protein [Nocardioides sp. 503]|uniref:SRPBCC family protein n=1 Tax=Nocardioides sp. 503 TaxID=2508326 RepID=UPI00106FEA7B|nr:SRPBCC family protein [Nocardioides sp. 503]